MNAGALPTDDLHNESQAYADDRAGDLARKLAECADPVEREMLLTLEINRAFLSGMVRGVEATRDALGIPKPRRK